MNFAVNSGTALKADRENKNITAEMKMRTDTKEHISDAPPDAGRQKRAAAVPDIGIIELKMLISAMKRVRYD